MALGTVNRLTWKLERQLNHQHEVEGVRKTIKRAKHIAQQMGFEVRHSVGRKGHRSSVYIKNGNILVRISDHELPMTDHQQHTDAITVNLVLSRPRSTTWLGRALRLAMAGRTIPGT